MASDAPRPVLRKPLSKKIAANYAKKTHFTLNQIIALAQLFRQMTREKLDRQKFKDFLYKNFQMTDDHTMERVFRVFDRDSDSLMTLDDWFLGMSVFLLGTTEEKTKFCFSVFDLSGDQTIGREEMFVLLKASIAKHQSDEDPDEGVKDLVELSLKKLDFDRDGRVLYSDFEQAVKSDGLFLEIFANCLPPQKLVDAFLEYLETVLM